MTTPHLPVGPRLERVLEIAVRSRLSVLLEGHTGIGKSEIVAQLAQRLGLALFVLDLSLLDPTDLLGIPFVLNGRTYYAIPSFLPGEGRGILLLEELGRAEIATRQPALQLLTARRLHEWILPPGWVVWASSNPAGEDYQVTPLDPALRARFLILRVGVDRLTWIEWAYRAGIHRAVLDLAKTHDRFLDTVPPRVWRCVSDLLHVMKPSETVDEGLLFDLLGETVGVPWVELLCRALEGPDDEPGADPRRLLAAYHADGALQEFVRTHRRAGHTDHLMSITRRVEEMLSADLAGLLANDAFRLQAFEALLADLPGDLRERLQEVFANHPAAPACIDLCPETILTGYSGTEIEHRIGLWLADPLLRHRVGAVANALGRHLAAEAGVRHLRRAQRVRKPVEQFVAHAGADLARSVVESLGKAGVRRQPPRVPPS